jgi:glutamate synthase domain-containing protein 3
MIKDALRGSITVNNGITRIDAREMYYRDLNAVLRTLNGNGTKKVELLNIYGQRYIGTDLDGSLEVNIHGIPGNDLGAFMNGPTLTVYGNAQDGVGNTMDSGRIVIYGDAGDIVGHSMRGGKIFIRGDAGYRVGIHMKEFDEKRPILVVGGTAQDFLGEYMAGGVLVLLGLTLEKGEDHRARFVGTGMHGGKMYIRGKVTDIGREVEVTGLEDNDRQLLHNILTEYCSYFSLDIDEISTREFSKVVPVSHRPYGGLYTH